MRYPDDEKLGREVREVLDKVIDRDVMDDLIKHGRGFADTSAIMDELEDTLKEYLVTAVKRYGDIDDADEFEAVRTRSYLIVKKK